MRTAQGLEHLSAREPDSGLVRVVVDTSKGSRNKYKYDETLGLYRLCLLYTSPSPRDS